MQVSFKEKEFLSGQGGKSQTLSLRLCACKFSGKGIKDSFKGGDQPIFWSLVWCRSLFSITIVEVFIVVLLPFVTVFLNGKGKIFHHCVTPSTKVTL